MGNAIWSESNERRKAKRTPTTSRSTLTCRDNPSPWTNSLTTLRVLNTIPTTGPSINWRSTTSPLSPSPSARVSTLTTWLLTALSRSSDSVVLNNAKPLRNSTSPLESTLWNGCFPVLPSSIPSRSPPSSRSLLPTSQRTTSSHLASILNSPVLTP